jgi:3-hydroxyisobutyrate dehydrogenase-like beta-hydroxyacid dehydrogenase
MMKKVGFIGLGEMGKPMALNLLRAGYELWVYDLLPEHVDLLVAEGAHAADNPAEIGQVTQNTVIMVPTSVHVREVVLGENGLLKGTQPNQVCIIMSTIDPMTVQDVSRELAGKGARTIDAPVARSRAAAEKGTLAIFVGGAEEDYQKCLPLLNVMGTDIFYVGRLGNGQVVKIVNNMILGTQVAILAEGLVLGVKAGVDPDVLVDSLEAGSANSFALKHHMKTHAMRDDLEGRFSVNYIMKDLELALGTAKHHHVPLAFTALAQQMYERARASGWGDLYYPVVLHDLENLTGVKVRTKNP